MEKVPKPEKRQWVKPNMTVYGDMATLTRQCSPPRCKPKELGFGDDFASNISTISSP